VWPAKSLDQASNQLWSYDTVNQQIISATGDWAVDIWQFDVDPETEVDLWEIKTADEDNTNQQFTIGN